MKKIVLFLTLLTTASAGAQTILVDNFTPVESNQFYASYTPGHEPKVTSFADWDRPTIDLKISSYNCVSGFALQGPSGGLIGSGESGYAVFDIGGKYSKLSFVMGPQNANGADDDRYSVITVSGDGRRLLDTPVFDHDAPRYITLDVTGVQQLKFLLPKGDQTVGFGHVKLWKEGQKVALPSHYLDKLPKGRIELGKDLRPYFCRYNGWVYNVKAEKDDWLKDIDGVSINRKKFTSGLLFHCDQGLIENFASWGYFWLGKRYDKISFIVGPRDNQSSNAAAWLIVKADKKTIWEGSVSQKDLAKQVVLDVSGAEQISFRAEYRGGSDMLGQINFGVVDIFAYPEGYTDIPQEGVLNLNKDKISKLPDVCPLMSNIRPFSVRGVSKADNTLFYGESKYITFSMGGQQYYEGFALTTGNTLLSDMIDSYVEFDLAGEFDWISFDAGCLSKTHMLDDDRLRIYADDQLIFDRTIYCTWPNQYYEIPVYKCRTLRFEKPGTGKQRQSIICLGDLVLYRGNPVPNNIFEHEIPDCPHEVDLIDLCGKPYLHYVGRYCDSQITSFSMDDAFHDGSTITKYFRTKDGRQIGKGFMLETNIPLGLENATLMGALFMFVTGVGVNLSSSPASAYTGVSAGADPVLSPIGMLLEDSSHKMASVAAFNPYGQYESCTFTVANIYEHIDDMIFGTGDQLNPVTLDVFADQCLVGKYTLNNKMEPLTVTVPIYKCRQLMFWLECGDSRSGQYVFYDLKLSKTPPAAVTEPVAYPAVDPRESAAYPAAAPQESAAYPAAAPRESAADKSSSGKKKRGRREKVEEPVEWNVDRYSSDSGISSYLRSVTEVWNSTKKFVGAAYDTPEVKTTWVQARDGAVYKCISFAEKGNPRISISLINEKLDQRITEAKQLKANAALSQPGVASATLGIANLTNLEDMVYYGKLVKDGPKALSQCSKELDAEILKAQSQMDYIGLYTSRALSVDGHNSTDTVLILAPDPGETPPATMQRLDYFEF